MIRNSLASQFDMEDDFLEEFENITGKGMPDFDPDVFFKKQSQKLENKE